jgi:hypothetical protein
VTSITVGVNMPHEDGKKSRLSDVTMMTKRSNHIPMLMMIETTNITGMFVRIFLNQKICGERTLQEIIVQYAHAYGPNMRFTKIARS